MPKFVRVLFLLVTVSFFVTPFTFAQTPPKTIKFQILPIPTRTPTRTPTPVPGGGGPAPGEVCTTSWITECKKSCTRPGARCGTGTTGAALYWCKHAVTVCTLPEKPPEKPIPTIPPAATLVPTTPPAATLAPTSPPPASNSLYDLVNQIKRQCGGVIYDIKDSGLRSISSNISCIQKLAFPNSVNQAVKDELWASTYSQTYLQCVGFVRAAVAREGNQWPRIYGNAIDYASTARPPGYTFIRKNSGVAIQVNDIPIWNYDTWGHIAYVTRVFNSSTFEVVEANFGCSGCVRIYNKVTTEPAFVGWLRKVR